MDDFRKIEMRVGRIVAVDDFPEARNPSFKFTIDFGPHGTRKSSAALRQWYDKRALLGRLVVCVTNFPPRRIATFDLGCKHLLRRVKDPGVFSPKSTP